MSSSDWWIVGYGCVTLALLYVGRQFGQFAAAYGVLSARIADALAVIAQRDAERAIPTPPPSDQEHVA